MDTLPVELLRLIFEYGDAHAARELRLVSRGLADVGYEYMMPSHFTAVGWRDDVKRLHCIATHDRLRRSIRSLTLNFSEVDEYSARHASYFQHWVQDAEERQALLDDAWSKFYKLDRGRKALASFDTQSSLIEDSFTQLTNLMSVSVTYATCPYDVDVLKRVFRDVPNCRKLDRDQACKNLNSVVSALVHAKVTSLAIDRVPLELFRTPENRRHWFDRGPAAFQHLERLDMTLDPSSILFPSSRMRAVNGLGRVLQFSPRLTHLSLAFQSYSAPREKFMLCFNTLLEDFTFQRLTDLRLEGINCAEQDLRKFLIRHGSTLERLQLGGKGLAKPYELSIGGVHLCAGTFKGLFTSLRGRLPKLQRFLMEGDFETGHALGLVGEMYHFRAVTDKEGQPVALEHQSHGSKKTIDCLEIEQYLLRGGDYPNLL